MTISCEADLKKFKQYYPDSEARVVSSPMATFRPEVVNAFYANTGETTITPLSEITARLEVSKKSTSDTIIIDESGTQQSADILKLGKSNLEPSSVETVLDSKEPARLENLSQNSPAASPLDIEKTVKSLGLRPEDFNSPLTIAEEIGRGGMGAVFLGSQKTLTRQVAVKSISLATSNQDNLAQFVAEARVTAYLDHPNIVPVHALKLSHEGTLQIVMKLVQGASWKSILDGNRNKRRSVTETEFIENTSLEQHLQTFLSVCNAIAFAHSRGILHLDLKPGNVMVGDYGEVFVMDWGLSADFRPKGDRLSVPSRVRPAESIQVPCGTPVYMAPELARGDGQRISPRTDVYLLGAILFEILNGQPPHLGPDLLSILRRATSQKSPQCSSSVPTALAKICHKALAFDPDCRYRSVRQLQNDLEQYLLHRESLTITQHASEMLEICLAGVTGESENPLCQLTRDDLYHYCSESIAGFEHALMLWPNNTEALKGEAEALQTLSRAAVQFGDIGLARTTVNKLLDSKEKAKLLEEIDDCSKLRSRTIRNSRLLKYLLVSSLTIIVSILASTVYLLRREYQDAQQRRIAAETVLKTVISEVDGELSNYNYLGVRRARTRILKNALSGLEQIAMAAPSKSDQERFAAEVLAGKIAFNSNQRQRAARHFSSAHEQWQGSRANSLNLTSQVLLFECLGELACANANLGQARQYFRQGIDIIAAVSAEQQTTGLKTRLAQLQARLGEVLLDSRQESLARDTFLAALKLCEDLDSDSLPRSTVHDHQMTAISCLEQLALLSLDANRKQDSINFLKRASCCVARHKFVDPTNTKIQKLEAKISEMRGRLSLLNDESEKACEFFQKSIAIRTWLLKGNPDNFNLRNALIMNHTQLALNLPHSEDRKARELLSQAEQLLDDCDETVSEIESLQLRAYLQSQICQFYSQSLQNKLPTEQRLDRACQASMNCVDAFRQLLKLDRGSDRILTGAFFSQLKLANLRKMKQQPVAELNQLKNCLRLLNLIRKGGQTPLSMAGFQAQVQKRIQELKQFEQHATDENKTARD